LNVDVDSAGSATPALRCDGNEGVSPTT
jgi:hypothetical protein